MDTLIFSFIIAALFAGIGFWAAHMFNTRTTPHADAELLNAQHETELASLKHAHTQETTTLHIELAHAQTRATELAKQLETQTEQLNKTYQTLEAERIASLERNKTEHSVLQALAPVSSTLKTMHDKVALLEQQRTQQHGEMTEQLRTIAEAEERLRGTAETLANALHANTTRGVWGETQLRSVVEAAGLIEHVDFNVQTPLTTDDGPIRPDMVIHLPGGKHIALDAKVPFNAYLEASTIPAHATGAQAQARKELLTQHVKAMRTHISTLGSKAYWTGLEASPELVVAFIPSESLVSSALETDPSLLEFAFSRHVALTSPVTLWSLLKTVALSWQQEVLTKEASELFDVAKTLYTRLSTTADHITKMGASLEKTVKNYNGFIGSLERSVLPAGRKLGSLDPSKILPPLTPIEEPLRGLSAPEFTAPPELPETHETTSEPSPAQYDKK